MSTKTMIKKCRKWNDPVEVKPHPKSVDVVPEFRRKRDENGNCCYVKIGEHSLSSTIQSYEKQCSLKAILKRCSLMPIQDKVAALKQRETVAVDLVGMPKDLTEAFIQAKELSKSYPELVKRISNGESLSDVVNSIMNVSKKEVVSDGKYESSHD